MERRFQLQAVKHLSKRRIGGAGAPSVDGEATHLLDDFVDIRPGLLPNHVTDKTANETNVVVELCVLPGGGVLREFGGRHPSILAFARSDRGALSTMAPFGQGGPFGQAGATAGRARRAR
jgi:hypothetical protein